MKELQTAKVTLPNNTRQLRVLTRRLSTEKFEAILKKLTQLLAERKEKEKSANKRLVEHQKKIEKYLSLLRSEGIDKKTVSKFINTAPKFKKARRIQEPRPAKYQYQDASGNLKTWTGQGRMPSIIKKAIEEKNKKLSDFLI